MSSMDIQSKNGEAWGTVYIVLFKIDGIYSVQAFTTIDKASEFLKSLKGYATMFMETLDRF